ncbi:MAG: tetratricopeptide repeat protein, partial [Thermodesulfobacteriota bacterium]
IMLTPSMPVLAEDYRSYIEQGDKYYEQFDNQKALEEYKKAYELFPKSFDALMKLTRAYNDVGEDIKGVKFRPEDETNTNKKVEENFRDAAKYAELLQKEFPDRADSYFLLAATYGHLALFQGGKKKVKLARDVEKNSKKAIELDTRYIPAYIVLGVYYREVANLNWALKVFAKTLFGGLPNGTDEDSVKTLQKAVQLNPQVIHTHFELAKTYDAMGEEDKVAGELKEILALPIADHQDKAIKQEAQRELQRLVKR